ncbi:MAG TPA: hypothetical protein VK874_04935 [Gaiellaceae bacterium]|nr:hypothetical protein [Gaiellaceae bacterium]
MTSFLRRLFAGETAHREVEDEVERELLEGRVDDYKEDVFVAEGDGEVFPSLSETTPGRLYGEFEADSEPPPDRAP